MMLCNNIKTVLFSKSCEMFEHLKQ